MVITVSAGDSCSVSKQDCSPGMYCNGDDGDTGKCQHCWAKLCETSSSSEEKAACNCENTPPADSCSVSAQDCSTGKYCNHESGDTGKCQDCWAKLCETSPSSEERAACDCENSGTSDDSSTAASGGSQNIGTPWLLSATMMTLSMLMRSQ
eukprot:gnl/TRDRNA2_/TRDRNA2_127333_c0_seq1.p1 gnl/TRDRNA2_/TRDRNA2_127333_c0~~gnl/TRDRNA2_/TRDRNA2_127333_c0_seq1.p1  ORF type:complete len:151 (-),score=15.94 gnl/TRDRNA2_/TRDRNA2_127333_c0_seq1:412-864(-)